MCEINCSGGCIKCAPELHNSLVDGHEQFMEGRKIYSIPLDISEIKDCADCMGAARYLIIEKDAKYPNSKSMRAWYWCGSCHIGG